MTFSQHRQSGFSLVSMMVGIVISLIAVLAMVATHRVSAQLARETNQELMRDGQVLSSLKSMSTEMAQAGYGILPTETGENLWVSADGKRAAWRYRERLSDAGFTCSAIGLSPSASSPGNSMLYLISDVACTSADATGVWASTHPRSVLADQLSFYQQDGEVLGLSLDRAVIVKESSTECTPYRYEPDSEDAALLALGGASAYPVVALMIDGQPVFRSCLVNLPQ